jgi:hypothetical protein
LLPGRYLSRIFRALILHPFNHFAAARLSPPEFTRYTHARCT